MPRRYRTDGASAVVTADPGVRLGGAGVLAAAERELILRSWNDTAAEVPAVSLPGLLEAQAARSPEAVAVACGDRQLTYRELDGQANQLARYLASQGTGPEQIVAIVMARTELLIVALLGVLKAGAAYLPVDPDYPAQRIAFMLGNARPALILTDSGTAALLPPAGPATLVLDQHCTQTALAGLPRTPLQDSDRTIPLHPAHPAYIIYTSGSTGTPKGVLIQSRSLVNFLTAMQDRFTVTEGDRLLAISTIGFDVAALEIHLPLIHGATVVLASRQQVKDPARLLALIRSCNATALQSTPSLWRALLAETAGELRHLHLLVGGETLSTDLAADLLARSASVTNLYGPTETTVWATTAQLSTSTAPPIGRPIANTRVYILDDSLEPVPAAVTGELYIAGAGLARGYLGQPGLTATRFTACPFARPGERMYRTGDLARWQPDGTLECLGRADSQVKVRGFRIELGEIEAVLERHPVIRAAAAAVREDQPGDKRIIAYIVPATPHPPALPVPAIRAHAAASLPDYMLPAAYVRLQALPLTPNGKLDRAALPAPGHTAPEPGRTPRTPREELLCTLFTEILGIPRISIDDSFFDLGGHSLLAAALISRIRAEFSCELSYTAFFTRPTVAGLSSILAQPDET
ncbi:MAG TPA: amino acid adenylation domain-containing protein [Streptosporangiaceae bacterium]|nr:amino acid adenylation domain-containing protein [Streptosporangiaceae bacterium]